MNNMLIYEATRAVPAAAQKEIKGGRLSGKTDINPMWRIKTLTEQFGIAGIGWKAPIKRTWLEPGANNEIACFCEIELCIKVDGVWSDGIQGIGGSMFIASEKNGLYTSDEAFKMAYTDAISVSCKALGFGADIYWNSDNTKYGNPGSGQTEPTPTKSIAPSIPKTAVPQGSTTQKDIAYIKSVQIKYGKFANKTLGDLTASELDEVCGDKSAWLAERAQKLRASINPEFYELPTGNSEEDLPF